MSNSDSAVIGFYFLLSGAMRNAVASVRRLMSRAVRQFQLAIDGVAPIPVVEVEPSLLFDPELRLRARRERSHG